MTIRIALAGNPNCGKTTMFNNLTGANQYVGNWPGVTVEKKEGKLKGKKDVIITDLPGIYSLSPYTLEEVVSRDYILNEHPDVIVNLVDATNIERNLYLTTQLIETGVPVVIALNMADLLEKREIKIDTERLSMVLGCPIIETSALKGDGLNKLMEEAIRTANAKEAALPDAIFSADLEKEIDSVKQQLPASVSEDKKRWYAVKLLENDSLVSIVSVYLNTQLDVACCVSHIFRYKDGYGECTATCTAVCTFTSSTTSVLILVIEITVRPKTLISRVGVHIALRLNCYSI